MEVTFTCPKCGMVSHNRNDLINGWCANCNEYTDPPKLVGHSHCPAPGCYWRIQHVNRCSRCGGPTVQQENCC